MTEFLHAIVALPTVLFSVPLALALAYWLFVMVGAADVDVLGGADGAAEGLAEGAAEGVAEGLAEGMAEGVAEGLAEGAAEGLAEGVADGAADGIADSAGEGLAWVMSVLRLRSAPVTVTMSLFFFWAWMISLFGGNLAGPILGEVLPGWAFSTLLFLFAFGSSLVATSITIRPMASLFETAVVRGGHALVGRTCIVRSGRVDEHFGQAEIDDGGAGILINVRSADENALKKGSEALLIDYEPGRDVYLVESMGALLGRARPQDAVPPVVAEPAQADPAPVQMRDEAREEETEAVAEEQPVPVEN